MTDRPLNSPTNLSSRIEDTSGTRHVFVEIPLDVLMDNSSESMEEEEDLDGIVLTVASPATAAMVDGDDTDDESSTPSIYHEPQGLEEVSASSDNGSSNGTVYFPGEDDSNNDSMSANATNFGMIYCVYSCCLLLLLIIVMSFSSKLAKPTTKHADSIQFLFFGHGVGSFFFLRLVGAGGQWFFRDMGIESTLSVRKLELVPE